MILSVKFAFDSPTPINQFLNNYRLSFCLSFSTLDFFPQTALVKLLADSVSVCKLTYRPKHA